MATAVGDAGNATRVTVPQVAEGVPSEVRPPASGGQPAPDPQVQGQPANVAPLQPDVPNGQVNTEVNGAPRPNVPAQQVNPPAPLEDPPPLRPAELPSSGQVLQSVKGKVNAAQTVETVANGVEKKMVDQQDPTLPNVLNEKKSNDLGPGELTVSNNWTNYDGPPPRSAPDGPASFLRRTDTGWNLRGRVWH